MHNGTALGPTGNQKETNMTAIIFLACVGLAYVIFRVVRPLFVALGIIVE